MAKFEYTAEIVARISEAYGEVANEKYDVRKERVAEIAKEIGTSEASLRAKLTSLKLYKAKDEAEAGAEGIVKAKKAEIVKAIGAVVGKDVESLVNASKADLETLWNFMVDMSNKMEVED